MATQPIRSSSATRVLLIGAAVAIFMGMGAFAVGIGAGVAGKGGPSRDGATRSQQIDTSPDSPVQKTLGDASRLSHADAYLVENSPELDAYALALQDLQAKLAPANGDENTVSDQAFAAIPIENIKKMRQVVSTMLTEQIPAIRAKVAANAPAEARTIFKEFVNNRGRLNELWYPKTAQEMVVTAVTMAKENKDSNYSKYPYSRLKGQRENLTNSESPAYSDCSAFMSYLLIQAGSKISPETPFDTQKLYLSAKNREMGLELIREATTEDGITKADIDTENLLQRGDIILSGIGPFSNGKPDGAHAAMYVGTSGNPNDVWDGDIVESSTREGGRNGVQFYTLEKRFSNQNKIQAILRYRGGQ